MRRAQFLAGVLTLLLAGVGLPAGADPWKDESGHGRGEWRRGGPPPWAGDGPPPWARGRGGGGDVGIYVPPDALDIDLRCNRALAGGVIGGALGGVLGSQVGKGDGRTVATVGGAVIGVLVGGAIGRQMDQADQACVAQALEYASGERPVFWRDPEDGVRYEVRPFRTYESEAGRFCREYETTAVIDGRVKEVRHTACREPEGGWRRMG
jgi:surface antigen